MPAVRLQTLALWQFRNYLDATLHFGGGVNCLLGLNGSGKTNILDAIHYLAFCKSSFNAQDMPAIAHGFDGFMLRGEFNTGETDESIACSVQKGQRKVLRRNQVEYERLSHHIGLLPAVIISPYDAELVLDGSEVRRRFMDTVISQYSQEYLNDLIHYNHALLQRNNLIKSMARRGEWHPDSLEPWDVQLVVYGTRIHAERRRFIELFQPVFSELYKELSENAEEPGIRFLSDLNEWPMQDILQRAADKDRVLERTTAGIHRDDLEFRIQGHELKKYASQGQQKTYLIALKLAQFRFLVEASGKTPILMLDDIFDKLDEKRTGHLLDLIARGYFGQVFITDTHVDRIPLMLGRSGIPYQGYVVEKGTCSPIHETVYG